MQKLYYLMVHQINQRLKLIKLNEGSNMKLTKQHYDGDPIQFDERPQHEQRLMMLIGGITGNYKSDYHGMEKAMSVRLNANNYPRVKALADLSGNSMNLVINDLIEVAYGVIMENATEESSDKLFETECLVREDWTNESLKKEQK